MKKMNLWISLFLILFVSNAFAGCTKLTHGTLEVINPTPKIQAGTTDAVIGNFQIVMGPDTNCDFTIHEVEFHIYGDLTAVNAMTNFRLYDENGVQIGETVPGDAHHGFYDHKIKFKDWDAGYYVPSTDLAKLVLKADIGSGFSSATQIKAVMNTLYSSYQVPTTHVYLFDPIPANIRLLVP